MTDREVITAYLEGKREAFDLVMDWIRIVVENRIWTERVSRDDVVSDTHEKLLTNLRESTFRLESSLKTYVQRITLYTCVDAVRRERTMTLEPLSESHSALDTLNPHEILEDIEDQQVFDRIVALLPDKCKQLWEMVFVERLKGRQIASRLGTSEGAIRTSLSRCKEKAIEIRRKLT